MPNAEPRANYCSLWSGSNLWNIWVNYLPPLARLSQVSWPWHALFMFNIIMKSPLCKLCNYFKWSYNNVRHLTGCSSQNKIQPSWFRGGLSNSNLSILRNCTMIHSWCGPVKIHRIATIVSRERIESFIMDKQIKTKYVVSTDFVWQNTYLPSVLISNHRVCDDQSWGDPGAGPCHAAWARVSSVLSRSVVAWLSQGSHLLAPSSRTLRKVDRKIPMRVRRMYNIKFILIGSTFDD